MESPDVQHNQSVYVITNEGKVSLLRNGKLSELSDKSNLIFVKVAGCSNNLWAICSDHRVYLRVESSLLVQEESYENQRWYPHTGFCNQLLPSDRYPFSSQDGRINRELSSVNLPSGLWAWDDTWHLKLAHEGTQLAEEGWTYAFDFVLSFSTSMTHSSYVRRRKWVRSRRYIPHGCWVPLPNSSLDSYIDIAVGGENLPDVAPGFVSVWTVTSDGSLFYREGVNMATCPEGIQWLKIETPELVSRVSVSPKGTVWILVKNGQLFARNGTLCRRPTGDNWQEVPPPKESISFDDISAIIDSCTNPTEFSSKFDEFKASLEKNKKAILTGTIAAGVSGVVVGVAAPFAIPAMLGTIGFTSGGVAAGSIAAAIQSGIGNVVAGSLFALCQSVGAAGIATGTAVGLGAGASVVGGVVAGTVAAKASDDKDSNIEATTDTRAKETATEENTDQEQKRE